MKPKRSIMFNLSLPLIKLVIANLTTIFVLNRYRNTLTLSTKINIPKIKKLQKGIFAHCFFKREKTNSDVYNEVHNYSSQNKHPRSFMNRRFGTAHSHNINLYVFVVNKAPQIGVSKRFNHKNVGHYKILDTLHYGNLQTTRLFKQTDNLPSQ